jgi:MOSC domain-containing protein YiiM
VDLIHILRAEGHPIAPGTIAENVTLAGVDWSLMVPGTRLHIGEVELEVTSYVHPCKNIAASFADGDSTRVSQKVHPGWSRLYAKVLQPGLVRVGSPVSITPV